MGGLSSNLNREGVPRLKSLMGTKVAFPEAQPAPGGRKPEDLKTGDSVNHTKYSSVPSREQPLHPPARRAYALDGPVANCAARFIVSANPEIFCIPSPLTGRGPVKLGD